MKYKFFAAGLFCTRPPFEVTVFVPRRPLSAIVKRGNFLHRILHIVIRIMSRRKKFEACWQFTLTRRKRRQIWCNFRPNSLNFSSSIFCSLFHRSAEISQVDLSSEMTARSTQWEPSLLDNLEINGGWRERCFPDNSYLPLSSPPLSRLLHE